MDNFYRCAKKETDIYAKEETIFVSLFLMEFRVLV